MNFSFVSIVVIVLFAGAFLAAWAGIRSIQSARSVVFYRTRQSQMRAGWQWLAASLVLTFLGIGSIFLGKPVIDQIFTPTAQFSASPSGTLTSLPTSAGTATSLPLQPSVQAPSATLASPVLSTATALTTPTRTPSYLGTYTALAIWTERRSTFIAMLSSTPTASRTPIPTWTLTPSNTPRPTYTASATRTPRPTLTPLPTRTPVTPPPTWTASPTRTPVTPRPTWTPSPTRTPRPTLTPTSTRTPTPTVTSTPTP